MGQAIMTMRLDEDKILRDGRYDADKLFDVLKEHFAGRNVFQISDTEFEGETGNVLFGAVKLVDFDWVMNNLAELKITFKSDGETEDILQQWKDGELDI